MMQANFISAADAFGSWRKGVLSGMPPLFYPVAESGPLSRVEIGPELITLIGGAPGAGKSALIMQMVVDALRLSKSLRAVVCSIEMPPKVLLDRQLSRLSGIALDVIRHRRMEAIHDERIERGLATLKSVIARLCFVRPPYDLENIQATVDAFIPPDSGCGLLIVCDYIQRIFPRVYSGDKRGSVDTTMGFLRHFADRGAAVLVVSSLARQRSSKGGASYDRESLNLASFKESGELEFGADDAFILTPDETPGLVELKHLKSRHGERRDVKLRFDGRCQSFTAPKSESDQDHNELASRLSESWGNKVSKGGLTHDGCS